MNKYQMNKNKKTLYVFLEINLIIIVSILYFNLKIHLIINFFRT
jgi:hypothetical protein